MQLPRVIIRWRLGPAFPKAVMKVVDELKRNGIVILSKPEIQIQNMVASVGLGGRIDLEKVTCSLKRTMYEPEQFPRLIHRMDDPKVVILIFSSGKAQDSWLVVDRAAFTLSPLCQR